MLSSNLITTQAKLLHFIQDNLSEAKNLSMRGLARLCGVDESSLREAAGLQSHKLGQKLTEHGIDTAGLVENGFDGKATWLVIEYFAYDSKAKAPGAKQIQLEETITAFFS